MNANASNIRPRLATTAEEEANLQDARTGYTADPSYELVIISLLTIVAAMMILS